MKKSEQCPSPRRRIFLLDELRGFAVFCMVFYHGFYTLAYLYNVKVAKILFRFFMPAQPWFAGLFILISGISCALSHSNLKRGSKLLGVALAVTLLTALTVPEDVIVFGILHFLSVCILSYGLWNLFFPAQNRSFTWFPLAVCAVLYLLTSQLDAALLGFGPFTVSLPQALYATNWLSPLGFHNATFFSADYFPLLPWCFVFAAGTMLGRLAAVGKFPQFSYVSHIPFFSWIGRYALIIYILHQPIIYSVTWLLSTLTHL